MSAFVETAARATWSFDFENNAWMLDAEQRALFQNVWRDLADAMTAENSVWFAEDDLGKILRIRTRIFLGQLTKGELVSKPSAIKVPRVLMDDVQLVIPSELVVNSVCNGVLEMLGLIHEETPEGEMARYRLGLGLYHLSRWQWRPAAHAVNCDFGG